MPSLLRFNFLPSSGHHGCAFVWFFAKKLFLSFVSPFDGRHSLWTPFEITIYQNENYISMSIINLFSIFVWCSLTMLLFPRREFSFFKFAMGVREKMTECPSFNSNHCKAGDIFDSFHHRNTPNQMQLIEKWEYYYWVQFNGECRALKRILFLDVSEVALRKQLRKVNSHFVKATNSLLCLEDGRFCFVFLYDAKHFVFEFTPFQWLCHLIVSN